VARPKKNRKRTGSKNKLSPIERMLKKKADSFLKAEREFWKYRYEIEEQHKKNAEAFDLKYSHTIPEDLSTIVWALSDGVAFVRYHSPGIKGDVAFRSWNITLKQWGEEGLVIPTLKGELSLARSGFIGGLGNFTLNNCTFNEIHIPYVELRHAYYDKGQMPSPVERAIIDFQLAFLGFHLRKQPPVSGGGPVTTDQTITLLKEISSNFEALLNDAQKEEELQIFIRENPMMLHPTADLIPKKKLGEDFITDFVLVTPSDQGPTYTLVEIEKSSHPILLKDNSLSPQTNHAIKQTRDWDVWLEGNKAYLQGKLPGFETPLYLVVIGRGNTLDDTAKAYLRSYNRDWKNIELLTYDDVLVRFNGVVKALEAAISRSSE
jgi:hypothetical protein